MLRASPESFEVHTRRTGPLELPSSFGVEGAAGEILEIRPPPGSLP